MWQPTMVHTRMALLPVVLPLLFIAGGHSQSPMVPPTTALMLPICTTAVANCQADAACSRSYATFERSCKKERGGMSINCAQGCISTVYALIGHPLGAATLLCDCRPLNPFVVTACRTSQINLAANCFRLPPGMPMCGRSCIEAWGRCFQDLNCASLVLNLPSKCSDVVAWNGEGDLPACCGDCRDTLNMISRLPNALELECCNCSGDLGCEVLQTKLSAACPSRTNCKRDCREIVPPTAPMVLPLCTMAVANCRADTACAGLYAAFEESCKEEQGGIPVNCTRECTTSIYALITHPLGGATLLCNCSNPVPFVTAACNASQTNLQANCFPAPPPGMPMCGRPCIEAWGRCQQDLNCASLGLSIPSKCSDVVAWNGEGDPPNCSSDCRDTLNMISRLPIALELECCNASGDLGYETLQTKLLAACPSRINCKRDCPQRNLTVLPCKEPGPPPKPGPPLCTSLLTACPSCLGLVTSTLTACSSVLSWDGQGDPPPCPNDCINVTKAIAALPNGKELSCCDCGEGAIGLQCEMTRTKITAAACGEIIDCNESNFTDEACPLDGDNPTDAYQCPVMTCQDILTRCPMHSQVVMKQLGACRDVLEWDGQGDPPMCPEACLTAIKAVEALPNAERLASCDCGEGPFGVQCKMNKTKLRAACDNLTCPSRLLSRGVVDCYTEIGLCARNNTCAPLMLDFAACVRNTGLKDTVKCHLTRIRLQEYQMGQGMSLNCTCVTFPDQCNAFKAALGMPEEGRPKCRASVVAKCRKDATCNAILQAWQSACSGLLRRGAKCSPHCMMTGSLLRQNILGSRVWPCLKGNINKAIKIKFLKLCLG